MGSDQTSPTRGRSSSGPSTVRLATWNLEWAQPATARGRRVAAVLQELADVVVCTECELGSLPSGHVVDAGTDWGYPVPRQDRRKVALWSPNPWTDVDRHEHPDLPPGRLVSATTQTPVGPLRVVGVCIPWRGAHVATGRKDQDPWAEHAAFLEHLPGVVKAVDGPFVVAGDFNQRIPRWRQPVELAEALSDALRGLTVPTTGVTGLGRLIDHIALGPGLAAVSLDLLPARDEHGPMSDHVGAVVGARPT